jgi:hypothetical protein
MLDGSKTAVKLPFVVAILLPCTQFFVADVVYGVKEAIILLYIEKV